jgi:hypothetical protein
MTARDTRDVAVTTNVQDIYDEAKEIIRAVQGTGRTVGFGPMAKRRCATNPVIQQRSVLETICSLLRYREQRISRDCTVGQYACRNGTVRV